MAKKPSFMKKMLEENAKKREIIKQSLNGERYGYMGDPSLHWSNGGYLRGHLNLFYGPSKSGKSTFSLKYAGQEQQKKDGGVVVILDTEGAYNDPHETDMNGEPTDAAKQMIKRLEAAGIDPDACLIWATNRASKLFKPLKEMEDDLAKDPQAVAAIIVDSWEGIQSSQTSGKVDKGEADDAGKSFGGNAKTINPILKRLLEISCDYGVTVFSVTHVRANMDQYGPKWIIPGGQSFVHLHAMIMLIEASETKNNSLLVGDVQGTSKSDMINKVGKMVRFRCDKSRATVEGKSGELFFNFMDLKFAKPEESLFNLATRLEVVVHTINEKTGKPNNLWWQFPANAESPLKWQGAAGAVKALSEDKNLYNELWRACMDSNKTNASSDDLGSVGVVNDDGEFVGLGG